MCLCKKDQLKSNCYLLFKCLIKKWNKCFMYLQLLSSNINFIFFLQLFLPFRYVDVITPIFFLEMNTQAQLELPQYVLWSETCNT